MRSDWYDYTSWLQPRHLGTINIFNISCGLIGVYNEARGQRDLSRKVFELVIVLMTLPLVAYGDGMRLNETFLWVVVVEIEIVHASGGETGSTMVCSPHTRRL